MKRRQFIALLGGATASWPLTARAQREGRVPRIGVLMGNAEGEPIAIANLTAFKQALQQQGWEVDRNLRVEFRWAAGDVDRMRIFAKELVELQPDLIVGHTTQVVVALQ